MSESRPIDITFEAKEKVTCLKIIPGLDAADELGNAAIRAVAGNVQAAVDPLGRRRDGSFVDRGLGGQVRCKSGRAE
jgi:hypothetical protein